MPKAVGQSFAHPAYHFRGLAAEQTARLLANSSDITLIVDGQDIVQDAAIGLKSIFEAVGQEWIGRKLSDTVTGDSEIKVTELLQEARDGQSLHTREINHATPNGDDIPVLYSASRLDDNGSVIVFGRDISRISTLQQKLMNSQLSIEREFSRLRAGESRYRMIFQLGDVPQIVVDATTLRVCDINPAALRMLGRTHQRVDAVKVVNLFDSDDVDLLHQLLRATVDDDSGEDAKIATRGGESITISASQFRQERKAYLLLRLSSDSGNVVSFANSADRKVLNVVDRMPDAFAITDSSRRVVAVNNAFIDLLNLSGSGDAEGQLIDTWFDRPNVDCNVLMANVREHGSVRRFATVLRTNYGQTENVEIAATQIEHHKEPIFGFAIRPMAAALAATEKDGMTLARSDDQITGLVGHMPLKDIVRETTELIEKLCIETALDLTKQNRALAAQMLGLSRQSLYAKLGNTKSSD